VTKAELVNSISEKLKEPKKSITPVVEKVFDIIAETLEKGGKCTFVDFGVFEVKDRAAREGRNPQHPTQVVKIPAKKVAVFRPGKALKEKVRIGKGKPGRKKK
jgi:DNA-binding protein HU-beta